MAPRRIPHLDLSHYSHGTPQERDRFVKTWGDGLREFGIVSLINHGIDSGDMLSRITNEVIPGTTRRVVNPPSDQLDVARYSMPYFVHPWPGCVLKVLDPCVTKDNPKRYPDITADDFLRQRLREIGLIKD